MALLAFVGTGTTGLTDLHEIWEVGLLLRMEGSQRELLWQLPVDLGRADSQALDAGGFAERRWEEATPRDYSPLAGQEGGLPSPGLRVHPQHMAEFAQVFMRLTWGAHLVGAAVPFDEERLRRLLQRLGSCAGWRHPVDAEAMAAGKLGLGPPWDRDELSARAGVPPGRYDRHTALGGARWAEALYDAVVVAP